MKCKTCVSWDTEGDLDGAPIPEGFGSCDKLKVHEGERYATSENINPPSEGVDIIICTSEWFQCFYTHEDFGCCKHEENKK